MTHTSMKLIDLYNLKDLNLNCDEAVQYVVNKIIQKEYKLKQQEHVCLWEYI